MGALVVVVMGVATYSVVRYDVRIVAVYTVAALLLAGHLLLTRRTTSTVGSLARQWFPTVARSPSLALVLAGVLVWAVPGFTYLTSVQAREVRLLLTVTAGVAAGVLVVPWRRAADVAVGLAMLGYTGAAVLLLRGDPAPSIDVWYILQGAADGLAQGQDMYTHVWVAPPGVMAGFTYLPCTAVLLAPGRWFAGDVRVMLVALTLVAALAVRLLAVPLQPVPLQAVPLRAVHRPDRHRPAVRLPVVSPATVGTSVPRTDARAAAGAAALLLVLPGTATQVEQAWTEPLLLCGLAVATLAMVRGHWGLAVVLLATGLASKQHFVLLLPLLAAWPRFGVRRAVATGALAAVLVSPWLIADPRAMLDDTVALLVRYQPLRFADSLYVAAINDLGWTPPFWATGAAVLVSLTVAVVLIRRRDPDLGTFLRWCALVLLVANLVNKQAFYNQYWLVAALVLLSTAVPSQADAAISAPSTPAAPGTATTAARTVPGSDPAPS